MGESYQDPLKGSVEFTSKIAAEILQETAYNSLGAIIAGVGTLAHIIRRMTPEDRHEESILMTTDMLKTYLGVLSGSHEAPESLRVGSDARITASPSAVIE